MAPNATANLYSSKYYRGEKTKTCQERPHFLSGHFIKVFYKTTTCPRQPLLNDPKSGRLIQVWLYILEECRKDCHLKKDTAICDTFEINCVGKISLHAYLYLEVASRTLKKNFLNIEYQESLQELDLKKICRTVLS